MNQLTIEQKRNFFCIVGNARMENLCGRDVMIIPIRDFAYLLPHEIIDHRNPKYEWVLVIEKNGKTWIWDSVTMEG